MKLLKIDGYWIVVSDEKPNASDWYIIESVQGTTSTKNNCWKVIASQNSEHNLPTITFSDEVVKELGIVDVEEFIKDEFGFDDEMLKEWEESLSGNKYADYGNILNLVEKALSDNKDKLFTLEQVKLFSVEIIAKYKLGTLTDVNQVNNIIQSLTKQEYECFGELKENYFLVTELK